MGSEWTTLPRRLLLLATLMLWQGGFTFYAAIVVPIGANVLGSELEQGRITREVTNYLNAAGVAALLAWAVELAAEPGAWAGLRRVRWPLWLLLVALLAILAWLHVRMDTLFDPDDAFAAPRVGFRPLHRIYLIVSSVQWLVSLLLLTWTVHSWTKPPR